MIIFRHNIALLWLSGVFAAAQLSKFSAIGPDLQPLRPHADGSGLADLAAGGGGAAFGFIAGLLLNRIGTKRALLGGYAIIIAATITEALVGGPIAMFAARAVEGIGYLLIVISAPTMIVGLTGPGAERNGAMVLWSTFVPVGVGIGSAITGIATQLAGAAGAMALWAVIGASLLACVARLPDVQAAKRGVMLPARGAWQLSMGFGCYARALRCHRAVARIPEPGSWGRIARGQRPDGPCRAFRASGSMLLLIVLRMIDPSPRRLLAISGLALAIAACLAPLVYRSEAEAGCAILAALMLMMAGMARSAIFARLPASSGQGRPPTRGRRRARSSDPVGSQRRPSALRLEPRSCRSEAGKPWGSAPR
jgi:MFS family permease